MSHASPRASLLLILVAGVMGCSDPPAISDGLSHAPGFDAPCSGADPGCPCTSPGLTTSCGKVERRSGTYVACSEGTQVCGTDGSWGACIGDGIATKTVDTSAVSGAIRTAGLSNFPASCTHNPCDPYCNAFYDTPAGLDAGPGFTTSEAGLALEQTDSGATSSTCTGLAPLGNQAITVTSISPVVTSPATTTFSTSLLPAGCWTSPLNPLWGVNRYDLAVVSGSGQYTHVVPVPATVAVTAYAGSFSASANVVVTVAVDDVSAAPSGYTAASFAGGVTSAEAVPTVLYPYDKTMFPLGLSAPLVMWKRAGASAAKAVRITLRFPETGPATFRWSAVIAEGSLRYQIPQSAWTAFEQTAKGSTGVIELTRIDSANKLQSTVSTRVDLATANLRGRIYYTYYGGSSGVRTVLPYGGAAPEDPFKPLLPSNCGVCHSVSASGNKLVTASEGGPSRSVGYNTFGISNINADGTLTALHAGPAGTGDSRGLSYAAITRTGTYALLGKNFWGNVNNGGGVASPGSAGPAFQIFQLPTSPGAATDVSNAGFGGSGQAWGLGGASPVQMYAPAFSPDNTRLVYVNADATADASGATAASRQGITYMQFDETAKRFHSRKRIVSTTATGTPADSYVRWPTWETDSRSIIFQSSPKTVDDGFNWYGGMLPSGCCGRIKVEGKLWSIDSGPIGGSPSAPVALAKVNQGLGAASPLGTNDTNRSYQPTMLGVPAGGKRWMVFTSVRAYGNLVNTGTGAIAPMPNKLWVAAIDDETSGTTDRSHAPFFLPNQDVSASAINERGYWSVDACKPPDVPSSTCAGSEECCGYNPAAPASSTAQCIVDQPLSSPPSFHCKSSSTSACVPLASSCTTDTSCCGFPTNRCVSGSCQAPPPIALVTGASFDRDYTTKCRPDQRLVWRFFDYKAELPSAPGASVAFRARIADTKPGLDTATPVTIATQTSTNTSWVGADVDAALASAGETKRNREWLRVTFVLTPSTDKTASPVVRDWRLAFQCVDAE
ncbi:MAG: hypothetical protein JST00_31870 [Deltaproteobacteria bacterium]|nr:hypothetical protein [Deltaproteobacteria bacterium]